MPTYYVGIDVSKFKHTCCIINENGEVIKKSFDYFGFSYCSNKHVINTLDYIGMFINGGSNNEVSWRYSYTGNLKSRINKYVTYENDLMKVGVNVLKLFMEITAAKLDMVGIDKHYRRFLKNDYRAGVDGHHPFSRCSIESNRFLTSDDEMKTI